MSEATCQREACQVCGSSEWTDAHYTAGVLVCAACCAEIRRAQEASKPAAAPPKPASPQASLESWITGRGARP